MFIENIIRITPFVIYWDKTFIEQKMSGYNMARLSENITAICIVEKLTTYETYNPTRKPSDMLNDAFNKINGNQMKTSEKAKAAGLKNLKELCELTGQSPQTIMNWDKNKPKLFKVVLAGAASINRESRSAEHTEK